MPDHNKNMRKHVTNDGRKMLKMKELMEASGAPKSTILHYVKEGLLPEPVRTGPNMAYYHPSCVERIDFIKKAQSRHRLPLNVIKGLLKEKDKGREVTPLLELQEVVFGGSDSQRLRKTGFRRLTGLTEDQVERLVGLEIIIPQEDGFFDREDVAIGKHIKYALDKGLEPEDWLFYQRNASQIVEKEMELRERITADLTFEENTALTLEMTKAARALRSYIIDRLFQKRVMKIKLKEFSPKNKNQE